MTGRDGAAIAVRAAGTNGGLFKHADAATRRQQIMSTGQSDHPGTHHDHVGTRCQRGDL